MPPTHDAESQAISSVLMPGEHKYFAGVLCLILDTIILSLSRQPQGLTCYILMKSYHPDSWSQYNWDGLESMQGQTPYSDHIVNLLEQPQHILVSFRFVWQQFVLYYDQSFCMTNSCFVWQPVILYDNRSFCMTTGRFVWQPVVLCDDRSFCMLMTGEH